MSGLRRSPATDAQRGLARGSAVEISITLLLGLILAASSLGLLLLQYGAAVRLTATGLITAAAAGVAAAAIVRTTVRLHRRWKRTIGRFTAAAALCAVAAIAGAFLVMIPGQCPGRLLHTGRCGVEEAAAWGQVSGLTAVLNFMVAGLILALFRGARAAVRDATAQCLTWVKALRGIRRRRAAARKPDRPHDPQAPKGRPTPRRADAERARRDRLRRA